MSQRSIYIIAAGVAVLIVVTWAALAFTSGPTFCGSCHIMKQYKTSHAISKHWSVSCSKCHVPQYPFTYYVSYKAKSGASHIYHNIKGDYPDVLVANKESRVILHNNCTDCHQRILKGVHTSIDEKPCYDCHRGIAHVRLDKEFLNNGVGGK